MSIAATTSTATRLVALHGDNWESPWWFIAIAGAGPDLTQWVLRAQVRDRAGADPLFTWTVDAAQTADTGVEIARGDIRLPSTGQEIELPAVQLSLRPRDWLDKPVRWAGYLEVELTRGPISSPAERRTIVRRRRFEITPDLVP